MTTSPEQSPLVDAYVRKNRIALEVFNECGHSRFHGVNLRTLKAFGRRGLVWFDEKAGGGTYGGLTDKGRVALEALTKEDAE